MKHLIIIGAGGFGREMFGASREAIGYGEAFDIKGYLDANPRALDGVSGYPAILGDVADYKVEKNDVFITALGNIESRRRCAKAIAEKGGEFFAIVHKSAFVGPNVVIGAGSFVAPHVSLTADVKLGRHVSVFHSSSIGHDSELGDFSHVYAMCSLGGEVKLAEGAIVYPGAVVAPRRTIGEGAVVGAGSTVIINVERGTTVFGSPAAPMK